MAYRVCYRVETGTNEYYDAITGKVYSSSSYTVKVPQYGEYGLVNYWLAAEHLYWVLLHSSVYVETGDKNEKW